MNNNQSTGDNPENKTTEKANEIKCHWEVLEQDGHENPQDYNNDPHSINLFKSSSSNVYHSLADKESKTTGTLGRNWFQRTWLNYTSYTMRSGIMTLLNTAKGVGCLSIPIGYAFLGMIPATIILTIAALNMMFTFYMMNRVQLRNPECQIYTDLVEKKMGPKWRLFLAIIFEFYLFGS